MDKIKILIVDDHPMMREALQISLAVETDMQIIGEASNGMEAVELAQQLTPDLIIMDLLMPGMNGLEAITAIRTANPKTKILVSTSLEDEEKVFAVIQAGALGYFPKTAPRAYLLEAIRKVADGIPYLPSGIAVKLFNGIRKLKEAQGSSKDQEHLTPRQEEVLLLLGEGRSDQEIAKLLHLEETTVRSHIHHILLRLGLQTRNQAVAYASHRMPKKD